MQSQLPKLLAEGHTLWILVTHWRTQRSNGAQVIDKTETFALQADDLTAMGDLAQYLDTMPPDPEHTYWTTHWTCPDQQVVLGDPWTPYTELTVLDQRELLQVWQGWLKDRRAQDTVALYKQHDQQVDLEMTEHKPANPYGLTDEEIAEEDRLDMLAIADEPDIDILEFTLEESNLTEWEVWCLLNPNPTRYEVQDFLDGLAYTVDIPQLTRQQCNLTYKELAEIYYSQS